MKNNKWYKVTTTFADSSTDCITIGRVSSMAEAVQSVLEFYEAFGMTNVFACMAECYTPTTAELAITEVYNV